MLFPGQELNSRPLHFIWIVNCSSSMAGSKIQSLNTAIREYIPALRQAAQSNPHAQVYVRVVTFSTGARWYISHPTPIEEFQWRDVRAEENVWEVGSTDMGKALKMVAEQLKIPPMLPRAETPVLILVSDGYSTDDFSAGLQALMSQPWGKRATRVAVSIGDDANYEVLEKFIGNPEIPPLQARDIEDIANYLFKIETVAIPRYTSEVQESNSSSTTSPTKENTSMSMPGGAISARPLHFFWIADCSGSMGGQKIQSLNTAIREAIPAMRNAAQSNIHAEVKVRAIKFSTGAQWHIATPTPLENFQWQDLSASGVTDMGKALKMVAEQLKMPPMESRGLPPVLVLITDGYPTDDVNSGIKAIMAQPWGKRSVRMGIGIGDDADYSVLDRFIANPEIPALNARNAEDLVNFIKWASTAAVQAASAPPAPSGSGPSSGPVLPTIPTPPPAASSQSPDVW